MQHDQRYVIRKYVYASSANEALLREKKAQVADIELLQPFPVDAIGFQFDDESEE